MFWIVSATLAVGAAGPQDGGIASPFQAFFESVINNPTASGARAGLTLIVLLVALLAGRWLADQAGRVLQRDDEAIETGRLARYWHTEKKRGSLSPWLGRITRASMWIAALAAIAVIWLYGQGIPAPNPRQLGASAGDLAVRVGGSLIVVAVALALGRILQDSLIGGLKGSRVNPNLALLGARVIYILTLVIGLIIILAIWGAGIVLPVTLLGALTVALSLALQDILKNLVAGIYLLIEHPFVISDHITSGTFTGQVEDIRLRVTVLRTADNQKVLIPNALLFTNAVINHSGYERRRAGLSVALGESDAGEVEATEARIYAALANVRAILREPKPQATVSRAAAGKLDLRVDFWLSTNDVASESSILSEAIAQVRSQLREAEVAVLDATAVSA